jgi:multiple sugar transport system substrate-binding protein
VKTPRAPRRSRVAAVAAAALMVTSCSTTTPPSTGSTPINTKSPIKGQHITVLLPSYAALPKSLVEGFQRETGVTVTVNTASWDDIHNQIVTAGAAGQAVADVTELDWSWTGQFGAAGWYEPLEKTLDTTALNDMQSRANFTYSGHLYGACYSNDARIGLYNTQRFAKAGITTPPTTFAQLETDLGKLKSSGASDHPLALTLSATEGAATEWYLLTVMMGGSLFDAGGKPVFQQPGSPAAQALQFEVDAVKKGLASPGSVGIDDQAADGAFLSGNAAVQLAGHPGELVITKDPKSSKIGGHAAYLPEPGASGLGHTFGLPEALGIPKGSAHKAAAAAFINWMMRPATQTSVFSSIGLLPCGRSVVRDLSTSGKLAGGKLIEQQLGALVPLFPGGAPAWYGKFSTQAAAQINAAAKGNISVPAAISKIADSAQKLAQGG